MGSPPRPRARVLTRLRTAPAWDSLTTIPSTKSKEPKVTFSAGRSRRPRRPQARLLTSSRSQGRWLWAKSRALTLARIAKIRGPIPCGQSRHIPDPGTTARTARHPIGGYDRARRRNAYHQIICPATIGSQQHLIGDLPLTLATESRCRAMTRADVPALLRRS